MQCCIPPALLAVHPSTECGPKCGPKCRPDCQCKCECKRECQYQCRRRRRRRCRCRCRDATCSTRRTDVMATSVVLAATAGQEEQGRAGKSRGGPRPGHSQELTCPDPAALQTPCTGWHAPLAPSKSRRHCASWSGRPGSATWMASCYIVQMPKSSSAGNRSFSHVPSPNPDYRISHSPTPPHPTRKRQRQRLPCLAPCKLSATDLDTCCSCSCGALSLDFSRRLSRPWLLLHPRLSTGMSRHSSVPGPWIATGLNHI